MTSRDFCFWLQGFFEVSEAHILTTRQAEMVTRRLRLVFETEPDPNDFCVWLCGWLTKERPGADLSLVSTRRIRDRLAAEFKHVIDPSIDGGDAAKKAHLNHVHSGGLHEPVMRC
jgi:hypothetical protein